MHHNRPWGVFTHHHGLCIGHKTMVGQWPTRIEAMRHAQHAMGEHIHVAQLTASELSATPMDLILVKGTYQANTTLYTHAHHHGYLPPLFLYEIDHIRHIRDHDGNITCMSIVYAQYISMASGTITLFYTGTYTRQYHDTDPGAMVLTRTGDIMCQGRINAIQMGQMALPVEAPIPAIQRYLQILLDQHPPHETEHARMHLHRALAQHPIHDPLPMFADGYTID